jgi:hypothetical protein
MIGSVEGPGAAVLFHRRKYLSSPEGTCQWLLSKEHPLEDGTSTRRHSRIARSNEGICGGMSVVGKCVPCYVRQHFMTATLVRHSWTHFTRLTSVHPGPQQVLTLAYFSGSFFAKGQAKRRGSPSSDGGSSSTVGRFLRGGILDFYSYSSSNCLSISAITTHKYPWVRTVGCNDLTWIARATSESDAWQPMDGVKYLSKPQSSLGSCGATTLPPPSIILLAPSLQ